MSYYQFGYLAGCGLLLACWLPIFIYRRDWRKQIIFGGLIALPLALTEFLFVPEYWQPPSLFDFIRQYGLGIEDFLFCFLGGGLASVIYKVIYWRQASDVSSKFKINWTAYIFVAALGLFGELIFPNRTIYNFIFALLAGAIVAVLSERSLLKPVLISGVSLAVLYFIVFFVFLRIFPDYVTRYYNLGNFIGLNIFGVPIEEIMLSFSAGVCWAALFKNN